MLCYRIPTVDLLRHDAPLPAYSIDRTNKRPLQKTIQHRLNALACSLAFAQDESTKCNGKEETKKGSEMGRTEWRKKREGFGELDLGCISEKRSYRMIVCMYVSKRGRERETNGMLWYGIFCHLFSSCVMHHASCLVLCCAVLFCPVLFCAFRRLVG